MAYPTFRFPMPRTFLYLMSLRTGTELILLTLLFNKISGLYGILALFTGFHLSTLQLSMYIYSLFALLVTCLLAPHIRRQSPLQNLAFAWFYLLDSVINAVYTATFGVSWFVVLAQHTSPLPGSDATGEVVPGGKMIEDTAGFTDPEHNVDHVDVVLNAKPGLGVGGGQEGTFIGHNDASGAASAGQGGAFENTLLQRGSLTSLGVISAMWLVRLYFILVVLAYARVCLRQYIATSSMNMGSYAQGGDSKMAEDPFAVHRELGQGWRGRLGRVMVSVGKGYWLGADDANEWERSVDDRFGRREVHGPLERERRRRAGTGPSQRPVAVELGEIPK